MPMPDSERILVLPSALVNASIPTNGFTAFDPARHTHLFDHGAFSFLSRQEVETNPAWKQVIPYVVLTRGNSLSPHLATYRRGHSGGEDRLHDLRSVGFGGHVRRLDGQDGQTQVLAEAVREVFEELRLALGDTILEMMPRGFINDDSDDVGKVHLGVLLLVPLAETLSVDPQAGDGIEDFQFLPVEAIFADIGRYELWSQHTVRAVYGYRLN